MVCLLFKGGSQGGEDTFLSCSFQKRYLSSVLPNEVSLHQVPLKQTSLATLYEELNQTGPQDEEGRRWHGYFSWNLSWKFGPPASVQGQGKLSVPCFVHYQALSLESKVLLRQYLQNLIIHEYGHLTFFAQEYSKLYQWVERNSSASPAEITKQGKQTLGYLQSAEVLYDQATEHGKTQGAQFPFKKASQ